MVQRCLSRCPERTDAANRARALEEIVLRTLAAGDRTGLALSPSRGTTSEGRLLEGHDRGFNHLDRMHVSSPMSHAWRSDLVAGP